MILTVSMAWIQTMRRTLLRTGGSAAVRRDTVSIAMGTAMAVLPVLVMGAIHLNRPFHGDTALFTLGAELMAAGGVLYVDFWDIKQPGIYLFFLLAGCLFGFDEAGAHTADLVWNGVFAVVVALAMRHHLRNATLALAAPFATVGLYYAFANSWHVTQLEFLVGLPLFLALLAVSDPARLTGLGFFASGVCAGIVVTFKLMLAPIPVAFWIAALVYERAEKGTSLASAAITRLAPAAAGGLTVVAAVLLWSHASGSLESLLWTTFVFPIEAAAYVPANSFKMLLRGAFRFGAVTFPWLLLAGAYFYLLGRRRPPLFAVQLALWLVVGSFVILLQKLSWWEYHFLLLIPPAGLLGLLGVDQVLARLEATGRLAGRGKALGAILLLAALPALILWSSAALRHAPGAMARGEAAIRSYQMAVSSAYARIGREVDILKAADALKGPIYVFGDPITYVLAGRTQAIPTMGWAWELQPPSIWARLAAEMEAAMPAYVVVAAGYRELLKAESPATQALLDTNYMPVAETADSIWYRRKEG
jgi:hypothetical protein